MQAMISQVSAWHTAMRSLTHVLAVTISNKQLQKKKNKKKKNGFRGALLMMERLCCIIDRPVFQRGRATVELLRRKTTGRRNRFL